MNEYVELNTNVNDYSIQELLTILNLEERPNLHQINSAAIFAINQIKKSDNYDEKIITFLENSKNRLIHEFSIDESNFENKPINSYNFNKYDYSKNKINIENSNYYTRQINSESIRENIKDADIWYQNQYLKQTDSNQSAKATDRIQQIGVFNDNSHFPMKQNYLGINQSIQLPFTQDSLNPVLRNLNTRIINIDSQFRPTILPFNSVDSNSSSSSTNYTFELSEPLSKVLSILLYSVQIPNTWYRFSLDQGNTCFNVDITGNLYQFNLPQGNYDPSGILLQLDNSNNWKSSLKPTELSWNYDYYSSKFSFILSGSNNATFYFYDISGSVNCNGENCINSSLNQNLGWSLGFRPDTIGSNSSTKIYTSFTKTYSPGNYKLDAVSDLYGPKYFSIILDDFNQNRQNKGLVNIGASEYNRLNLPNYYSNDVKLDCCGNTVKVKGMLPGINSKKYTQAQMYSINQILTNRTFIKQRNYGLNSSDVLAILPIDVNSNIRQQPYTSFGANLLLNERRYYGPVDITKMKVRLVDDKGNTVNLNGADWCMSIIVNELYQY